MQAALTEPAQPNGCVSCNHPVVESGATPLCSECRQKFIKYPIPLWIKIFGAVIAAVFLFSMYRLPKTFTVAMHLEKGKKAEAAKNYLTAQKEFTLVAKKFPANLEAKGHLMIAAFYNQDMNTVISIFKELENKVFDDKELLTRLDAIIADGAAYLPGDSLMALSDKYKNADSIPDFEIMSLLEKNPGDVYAETFFASALFNRNQFQSCDSMLSIVLANKPDYIPAITIKATLKRELNQPDSSILYCDKALAVNHQNAYMLSSKARTLLKQHKDAEALELAASTYKMNEKEYYSLATMALVYHFTHKLPERDAMIKLAESDSAAAGFIQYPKDVISGQEKFRD